MSGFNPGAYNFVPGQTFVPGQAFVPRSQQQQQPGGQQQQPGGVGYPQQGYNNSYQQPYNPAAAYAQSGGYPQQGGYGGGYQQGGYRGGPQQGGYGGGYGQNTFNTPSTQPSTGFPPPLQPRYANQPPSSTPSSTQSPAPSTAEQLSSLPPKTISLGGSKPTVPFVRKEATEAPSKAPTLSLGGAKPAAKVVSLGGGSSAASKTTTPAASTPKASSTPKTSATPVPASTPASRTSTPAPAVVEQEKAAAPAAKPINNFSREIAKTSSDAVLAEAEKLLAKDTLTDLYGGKTIDENAKEHLNIVFIGHVDAGKSTMGGQLLYLTGMVDKRTLEKFEKEAKEAGRESWYLSWALDSTPQERAKGKTVEVGRAYFETTGRRYTILDAPGHKMYVPHMISGASQADVALLVISARKGEFEAGFEKGGQTREHAQLVKTAGVSRLIVVVNKMDDPTVEWSLERFDFIKNQIGSFLKKGIFNPKDVTYIPVSAYTGANMKEQVSKEMCPWNTSVPLIQFLDEMQVPDRKVNGPLMLPVSEKYNELGTMLVGKLESGRIYRGDSLILMPNKTSVEVTNIYDELNEELESAYCGDNIRVRCKGITDEDVSPGYVLCNPAAPANTATQFQAQLAIMDSKNIITAGFSCILHAHSVQEEITIVSLLHYLEPKTGRKSKKPPPFAKPGQQIIALIETTEPICIEKFADYAQLGRFTLREEGKTIAIGKVTKLIKAKDVVDVPDVSGLSVTDA